MPFSRTTNLIIYFFSILQLSLGMVTNTGTIGVVGGYAISTVHSTSSSLTLGTYAIGQYPTFAYILPNMTYYSATFTGIMPSPIYRIRSTPLNIPNTNHTYLYFNESHVYIYIFQNTMTTLYIENTFMAAKIRQACFGEQIMYRYLIVLEISVTQCSNSDCYVILCFNGTTLLNKIYLPAIDTVSNTKVDLFWYDGGRLIIVFPTQIEIYYVTNFTLLTRAISFAYLQTTIEFLDACIEGDLFMFSVNDTVYFYNLTSFTYIGSLNMAKSIESIAKTPNTFIIKTIFNITQYDFQTGFFMDFYQFSGDNGKPDKIRILGNKIMVFVDSWQLYDYYINTFSYSDQFYCSSGCTSCPTTFYLNGGYCQKNITLAADNTQILVTANMSVINASINTTVFGSTPSNATTNNSISTNTTTNNSISTNTTTNNNTNSSIINTTLPIQIEKPQNDVQSNFTSIAEAIFPTAVSQTLGSALALSSMRAMPKFLLVFTLFLNDLVYYRQHRKFNPQYPNSTLMFMEKVDLIKQLQLNNAISQGIQYFFNNENLNKSNQIMIDHLDFTDHDPSGAYFLYSTTDFYQNNLITTILYFVTLKSIHFLLYLCRNKHSFLFKGYKFVRIQTKWWSLVVAIIEVNSVMLAYNTSIQLLCPGNNFPIDKVNLIFMYVMFFLVIVYSLCFYGFVYLEERKKCSKILIVYTKCKVNSFFLEPILIIVRGLVKSFVHGFFIYNYQIQIILLFILDFPFLFLSFAMYNYYRNKGIFLVITTYLICFLFLDLYFVLEQHTNLLINWDRQLCGFIFCCAIAIISLLLSLNVLFVSIMDFYKKIRGMFGQQDQVQKNDKEQDLGQLDKPDRLDKFDQKSPRGQRVLMKVIQNEGKNRIFSQFEVPESLNPVRQIIKAKIKKTTGKQFRQKEKERLIYRCRIKHEKIQGTNRINIQQRHNYQEDEILTEKEDHRNQKIQAVARFQAKIHRQSGENIK